MIIIIDQDYMWDGRTFESKKELKEFLQEQSAKSHNFDTEEEYYEENAHVSLNDYCDLFQIEYKERITYEDDDVLSEGDFAQLEELKEHVEEISDEN